MKKYFSYMVLSVICAVSFFIIFSGFSYRADMKIGYIQSQRLELEYSKLMEAKKTLEQEGLQLQNNLQKMQQTLQQKFKDYENQKLLMSATRKAEAEKELTDLDAETRKFAAENFNTGGKLDQRWIEISQPIIDEIQAVIDKLGEDEEYDIILDARDGTVLYGRTELDITDRLLEELEKKN